MVNYMKVATCVCKIISFVEIRHFITRYLCKSNTEIAAFVDNNKKSMSIIEIKGGLFYEVPKNVDFSNVDVYLPCYIFIFMLKCK